MAHQDNVAQILAFDLVNDVLDVGLLPSWHTPLFGKTGQRQRVSVVASRARDGTTSSRAHAPTRTPATSTKFGMSAP